MRRAEEEKVRVLLIGDDYYATSSSQPLHSYRLESTAEGWTCACPANAQHGMPCKHLWRLAELLNLDVLSDVRLDREELGLPGRQAA